MDFAVPDSSEGSHYHVEAVEPSPSLDEMKSDGSNNCENQERQGDPNQIAERVKHRRQNEGRRILIRNSACLRRKAFRISAEGPFWEFSLGVQISVARSLQHCFRMSLLNLAVFAAVAEVNDQSNHQPYHQPSPGSRGQAVHHVSRDEN